MQELAYKLRLPIAAVLVIANILVFSLIFVALSNPHAQAEETIPAQSAEANVAATDYRSSDSPNAVTSGFTSAGQSLGQAAGSLGQDFSRAFGGVGKLLTTAAGQTASLATSSTTAGLRFVAGGFSNTVGSVIKAPGHAVTYVASAKPLATIVKPGIGGSTATQEIPTITTTLTANNPASPAATGVTPAAATNPDTTPQWPIHGQITTFFGVPHWPFQPTHTGIDISDGKLGVTQVRPYRPGRVIQVNHSNLGLGNHVIVEHGGGITSVYAHLNSTSVQVGQAVDKSTVLGIEGTTGASTGAHVHFEIRVNGQPTNPMQHIPGRP